MKLKSQRQRRQMLHTVNALSAPLSQSLQEALHEAFYGR